MYKVLIISILMGMFMGCGRHVPEPETEYGMVYHNERISFQYPSNWKIVSQKEYEKVRITQVESPGYAGVTVYFSPEKLEETLSLFVVKLTKEMESKSTPQREISKEYFTQVESEDGYKIIIGEYTETTPDTTMEFRKIYKYKEINGMHYYLVNYSPSDDTEIENRGFKLISSSLKSL